jgi:hypothetical protein
MNDLGMFSVVHIIGINFVFKSHIFAGACEYGNELSGSIKFGKFLD